MSRTSSLISFHTQLLDIHYCNHELCLFRSICEGNHLKQVWIFDRVLYIVSSRCRSSRGLCLLWSLHNCLRSPMKWSFQYALYVDQKCSHSPMLSLTLNWDFRHHRHYKSWSCWCTSWQHSRSRKCSCWWTCAQLAYPYICNWWHLSTNLRPLSFESHLLNHFVPGYCPRSSS